MMVSDDMGAFAKLEDVVKGYIFQALHVRTGILEDYYTGTMRVKFFWTKPPYSFGTGWVKKKALKDLSLKAEHLLPFYYLLNISSLSDIRNRIEDSSIAPNLIKLSRA